MFRPLLLLSHLFLRLECSFFLQSALVSFDLIQHDFDLDPLSRNSATLVPGSYTKGHSLFFSLSVPEIRSLLFFCNKQYSGPLNMTARHLLFFSPRFETTFSSLHRSSLIVYPVEQGLTALCLLSLCTSKKLPSTSSRMNHLLI